MKIFIECRFLKESFHDVFETSWDKNQIEQACLKGYFVGLKVQLWGPP